MNRGERNFLKLFDLALKINLNFLKQFFLNLFYMRVYLLNSSLVILAYFHEEISKSVTS